MGVASCHEPSFNMPILTDYEALQLGHEKQQLLGCSNHALRGLRDVPPWNRLRGTCHPGMDSGGVTFIVTQ